MVSYFNILQSPGKMYHSIAAKSRYLLVVGGRNVDNAMDTSLHAYSFACNSWFNLTSFG